MSARHVLALVVLAAAGTAHAQADLNVITAVGVKDDGANVVLEVKGSKPPNFTTFSMADPPRFVIDLSEAKFQGVAEDMPVNDGTILVVKNLSYGSDATSIARVMVAFVNDVEPPDVQAVGNALVVRIAKPAAGGAVARADDATQRARDDAEARARAEAEAQASAEADRRAREEAAAAAAVAAQAQAKADADRLAREEAEAKARAEVEAELKAEAERQASEAGKIQQQAEAMSKATAPSAGGAATAAGAATGAGAATALEETESRAREGAVALAGSEEEKKAAAEARKEELRKAREDYERQRQEAIAAAKDEAERNRIAAEQKREEERRAREEARLAREQEKQQKAEEARAAKEAEKQKREEARLAREQEKQRKAEEARAAKEAEKARREEERQAKIAAREAEKQAQLAVRDRAVEFAGGTLIPAAQLREIGFRQMPGVSRVFVRTSAPPQFTIQDVGENTIRVELQNTKVARRNDTRFLDTSFFPSAVAMITPSRRGSSYVVEIKLKQRVPYQQKIEGDMLAIDFERPGAPAAEAPAPGAGAPAAAAEAPATDSLEQPAVEGEPAAPAEAEPKK